MIHCYKKKTPLLSIPGCSSLMDNCIVVNIQRTSGEAASLHHYENYFYKE